MKANAGKTLHVFAVLCISLAPVASWAEADPSRPLPVVASFSILADWLHEVGGERIAVTSLVPRNADAHTFRPAPSHVRALAKARLVFINGLGFEGWLQRLLNAADTQARTVILSKGIVARTHGDFSDRSTHDPHAWHSVPNAMVYVANIAAALCAEDAAGCTEYNRRAQRYIAKLIELDAELRNDFARIAHQHRKVIASHDAFGYLADEYDIDFLALKGTSTDTEASARHVALLIAQARRQRIPLFLENVTDARLLEQVARETGQDPSAKLYSDALSPKDGPAGTYIQLMRHNTAALVSAMLKE